MNWQNNYIDIHSHILPGIDDGSESMEQTIKMLHIAAKEQITTIIATPHYEAGRKNPSLEYLRDITKLVQYEARKIHKDFRIFLGNEIFYSESIIEALKSGKALTLAGSRYVLVEFPYGINFNAMKRGINDLIYHGYIPILAHIERYYRIHGRQDMIEELIRMGCYIQMNCDSVIGGFMTEASYNRKLLNNDLIHFLSSDCHSDRVRIPLMQKAVKHLLKKCDDGLIMKIFSGNPAKILANTFI